MRVAPGTARAQSKETTYEAEKHDSRSRLMMVARAMLRSVAMNIAVGQ
jgi:hypothetical protein